MESVQIFAYVVGAIIAVAWTIATFVLPFLVWGIYNSSKEAVEIAKEAETYAKQTAERTGEIAYQVGKLAEFFDGRNIKFDEGQPEE